MVPIVKGTAVFKGEEMVGWLDGDESFILSLLRGDDNRGILEVDTVIEDQQERFTYELVSNSVKVRPVVEAGQVSK